MTTRNRNPDTLAAWRREGVFLLEGHDAALPDGHSVARMDHYLTEATAEIALRFGLFRTRFTTNLVAGQVFYDGPGNRLACPSPYPLTIVRSDGSIVRPTRRSWTDFLEVAGDPTNPGSTTGVPTDWAFDESGDFDDDGDGRRIAIWPPDSGSVTNGLRLDYQPHPGILGTVIESGDESITATLTSASETVTLSGAPTTGVVAVGMAFGEKRGAVETSIPTSWYRIRAVSGTTLTLSGGYEGSSGSGRLFTISDVSRLGWVYPGLLGSAPIHWMEHRLREGEDMQSSMAALAKFEADCARISERLKADTTPQSLEPLISRRLGSTRFR
jgi:hypothetical protein